jgi:hypothetical protein
MRVRTYLTIYGTSAGSSAALLRLGLGTSVLRRELHVESKIDRDEYLLKSQKKFSDFYG